MLLYLPIAEISVNALLILIMGAAVGFLSGIFGIGGGFLMTPLLIFYGITPTVAVGTGAVHVVASSVSGALSQIRRGGIDFRLGLTLVLGGCVGSWIGAVAFRLMREAGILDVFISLSYMLLMGVVGILMLIESVRSILRARRGRPPMLRKPGQHNWIHRLPFKVRFQRSRIYLSVIPVAGLGALIGFLGTVVGVGGGFIIVPALIYLLRVPSNVVVGTSQFQIVFVMATATVLHAVENHSVDLVLAMLLMVGGVFGAQLGSRASRNIRGEQLRALLALLVLSVGLRFGAALLVPPSDPFSLTVEERENR